MSLSTSNFLAYAAKHGLEFAGDIVADGELHRVHVKGDKPNSKNGWYVCHDGEVPFCIFNTWKEHGSLIYSAGGNENISKSEMARIKMKVREQRAKQKRMKELRNIRAEIECGELYKSAATSYLKERASGEKNEKHIYCTNKGIEQRGGALILREKITHERENGKDVVTSPWTLLVPMQMSYEKDTGLIGLQKINYQGAKFFHPGSKTEGAFCVIESPRNKGIIYICESYSTGSTVSEEMYAEVWVSFSAYNLRAVAKKAKETGRKVVICRDDDWAVSSPIVNPGKHYAEIAKDNVDCQIVTPEFGENRQEKDTDFNDMPRHLVRECILKQLEE